MSVTLVQRGEVLPHRISLTRGPGLPARQLHGTDEVRKPRHRNPTLPRPPGTSPDALRTHGRRLLADLFATDRGRSVTDLLLVIGRWLPRRRDAGGYLIVEALVAARRDEDVARPMRGYVGERADWIAELMRVAQTGGELDPALSPNALAHFCLLLAMGSALVTPDLHAVDDEEWTGLLSRIVTALARTDFTAQTGTTR